VRTVQTIKLTWMQYTIGTTVEKYCSDYSLGLPAFSDDYSAPQSWVDAEQAVPREKFHQLSLELPRVIPV